MVANYTGYMKALRDAYIPKRKIIVLLPPTKADCTCLNDGAFSMINTPTYCDDCNNKGYIETQVDHTVYGSLVDFMSDSQTYPNHLNTFEQGNFSYQRYVIHATASDCTTALYDNRNSFELSKKVIIDGVDYRVLSIDPSSMLGELRVMISKTN